MKQIDPMIFNAYRHLQTEQEVKEQLICACLVILPLVIMVIGMVIL